MAGAAVDVNNFVTAAVSGTARTASGGATHTNANQTVNSNHSTIQTSKDSFTQYQVYEKEKILAQETQKQVQQDIRTSMNKAGYSQFTIKSNNVITKEIMAGIAKKYDRVQLSFMLNGVTYMADWTLDEIEK